MQPSLQEPFLRAERNRSEIIATQHAVLENRMVGVVDDELSHLQTLQTPQIHIHRNRCMTMHIKSMPVLPRPTILKLGETCYVATMHLTCT